MSDPIEQLIREISALRREVDRLKAKENHDFSALNVGTGTGAVANQIKVGSAALPGKITVTDDVDDTTNDLAIQANQPLTDPTVAKDQLGMFIRNYGVITDFVQASAIVSGACLMSSVAFGFSSPKAGDITGAELECKISGGTAGGNMTGSLWGGFGHVDFLNAGNGITITNAFGLRGDIGHSSSATGYTITNAIAVYGVNPAAANIGTITNAYSFFGDGRLGIGGTPASPKAVINADGSASFGDAGLAGQALRIGATVNAAASYGVIASPALGASVTALSNIHSYPVVATRTPTNVYGFYAAQPYRSTGSVTNQYGMKIENMGASWVTNAYGLYINAQASAVTLNYAIYSAGGLNYFVGDVYAVGDVSALTFTDRTPHYQGDAIGELLAIRGDGRGGIDHKSLPAFAQHGEGRDLGAMISVLTVAIQQIVGRLEKLEKAA